jgi:hypothetical protein
MQRHALYAYVDGSDLEDVAAPIEERLLVLAAAPGWVTSRPTVVNQKANVSGGRKHLQMTDETQRRLLTSIAALPRPTWYSIDRAISRDGPLPGNVVEAIQELVEQELVEVIRGETPAMPLYKLPKA